MLTEINMCALVSLEDLNGTPDKKELEKIILINVPTEIYPNIREIFILLFEKSGFKDVKIEKIVDFEKLYLQSQN